MPHTLVTGATNGIGEVTARELARRGHRVGVHGRSAEKVERVVATIRQDGGEADGFVADFASLDAVRALAGDVLTRWDRLDVLVNNAGLIATRAQRSQDGHELMIAVNHLAPFLLTNLLLERLRESAPSRIVNVASDAHYRGHLDIDDLDAGTGFRKYGGTKLANILFTRSLAARLAGSGVTANSMHPGFTASGFGMTGWMAPVMVLTRPFQRTVERAADTVVWLADSEAVASETGKYWLDRREKRPSRKARDDALAERLWDESARRVGLAAD